MQVLTHQLESTTKLPWLGNMLVTVLCTSIYHAIPPHSHPINLTGFNGDSHQVRVPLVQSNGGVWNHWTFLPKAFVFQNASNFLGASYSIPLMWGIQIQYLDHTRHRSYSTCQWPSVGRKHLGTILNSFVRQESSIARL
jgi:hypothetical protein